MAWVTVYRGVRYREHESRVVGRGRSARPDRYFVIRYSHYGVMRQEGVGWESEGYSESEAIHLLSQVRRNLREGVPPFSLAGMREAEREKAEREKREALRCVAGMGDPLFRDAARLWLAHAQETLRSWRSDEGRLRNHLIPLLGDVRLAEMDKGHVLDLVRKLARRKKGGLVKGTLSQATIRQCVVLAGRVLEFARTVPQGPERKVLLSGPNPVHGVKMRKTDNSRWRVIRDDEVAAILKYCVEHGGALAGTYRMAVLIGLECGARLDEIMLIRKEHLDPAMRRLRLMDTKNDDSRFVYPPDLLLREIMDHSAAHPDSPWLFPSHVATGKPVNKDTVGHFFAQAVNALKFNQGVEDRRGKLVFHSLRHTFGTRQVMAGTNLLALKRLMGHRSLTTTERYVHLAEDFVAASRK